MGALRDTLLISISYFCRFLEIIIFVRCIISWLPINRSSGLVRIVYTLTEPLMAPIRNMIQKSPLGGPGMMMDFSPIIVLILIDAARMLLQSAIISIF